MKQNLGKAKQYFAFQWHITDDCDQRCKHCYIFSEDNCKKLDSMTWEQMQEVLANCEDFCRTYNRIPYFYITGGDPILHPDFWKLMECLKEKEIPFTILGNPFHLTDEVCTRLKACGCQKYQLSLDGMYFFTARGKAFARELERDGRVQILGYTKYKEMIRVSAKAVAAPAEEQTKWMDRIFMEQPYLKNVYPGDTREIGVIYEIRQAQIEYFHLGVSPIFRETYTIGGGITAQRGYRITEQCIGCGTCLSHCPQKCIAAGEQYSIRQEHCLHCGNCFVHCPVGAVRRVGEDA